MDSFCLPAKEVISEKKTEQWTVDVFNNFEPTTEGERNESIF